MYKKSLFLVLTMLLSCTIVLKSQTVSNNVTDAILAGYSAKVFTTIPVSDSQIDLIVRCGIKAPSGRNGQPWKFTVVKSDALSKEIIPNITAGNIIIIVSGQDSQQPGISTDFDCALATENMYIAAQSLGLGAHIYMSPVNNINTSKKQTLSIPDGYKAVSILRIGNIDKNVDATSSASTRKKTEEVVNYK
jgi:nitroreductase